MERKTGFEPATFSLARRRATTAPLPPDRPSHDGSRDIYSAPFARSSRSPFTFAGAEGQS